MPGSGTVVIQIWESALNLPQVLVVIQLILDIYSLPKPLRDWGANEPETYCLSLRATVIITVNSPPAHTFLVWAWLRGMGVIKRNISLQKRHLNTCCTLNKFIHCIFLNSFGHGCDLLSPGLWESANQISKSWNRETTDHVHNKSYASV